jgi:hypothetical protein
MLVKSINIPSGRSIAIVFVAARAASAEPQPQAAVGKVAEDIASQAGRRA